MHFIVKIHSNVRMTPGTKSMLYKYYKMQRVLYLSLIMTIVIPSSVHAAGPDVELMRIDGVEQQLTDYIGRGKWVVVNVWSPSCSACVKELPELERFEKKHRGKITVLGVTIDFPSFEYGRIDILRTFLKHHPLEYPLFLADLESASDVIGNRLVGIPLTAIFHPNGKVLARWPGDIESDEIEEYMQNYSDYLSEDELTRDF